MLFKLINNWTTDDNFDVDGLCDMNLLDDLCDVDGCVNVLDMDG